MSRGGYTYRAHPSLVHSVFTGKIKASLPPQQFVRR